MITTDESLILQSILSKMNIQDILYFVENTLSVKADKAGQARDFKYSEKCIVAANQVSRLIISLKHKIQLDDRYE